MKNRKLKNKIFIIGFSLATIHAASQNIQSVFIGMPDKISPTMSKQNRVELLEYHKANMGDSIMNRFGEFAFLQKMDSLNEHIVLENTASSIVEIKLLHHKGQVWVGVINTVCAPICHSSIQFYDTAWNVLPMRFNTPKAIDWLMQNDSVTLNIRKEWLSNALETSFVSLSFADGAEIIEARSNALEFISEEDRKIIVPFLSNKPFRYRLVDDNWQVES